MINGLLLGKALRQVHEIDVPPSIKDQIRKEAYSSKWREAVRSLYAHIEANLTGDETALKLQAFMKEHRAIIHRLVDRAEAFKPKDSGTIARIRAVPFRHSWWQRIDRWKWRYLHSGLGRSYYGSQRARPHVYWRRCCKCLE